MVQRKYVYIEWIDSHCEEGWQTSGFVPDKDLRCFSVGFVYEETKHTITICHSLSSQGGPHSAMTIPKIAITKLKRFKI